MYEGSNERIKFTLCYCVFKKAGLPIGGVCVFATIRPTPCLVPFKIIRTVRMKSLQVSLEIVCS